MTAAAPETAAQAPPGTPPAEQQLALVRANVRDLLDRAPEYKHLEAGKRRELAHAMVRLSDLALSLMREEADSEAEAERNLAAEPAAAAAATAAPLAAGDEFSGVSAERVAGVTRRILNAVSFPRFVTELVNGVFKAVLDSNMQQMNAYVELLNNVSASTEGFADTNFGAPRARQWLAERFPGSFEVRGGGEQEEDDFFAGDPDFADSGSGARLILRQGGEWPSEEALRVELGLAENETVPRGDPERVLVPLARRQLSRNRQQMLATLVMLGMQRIVIDHGRINASMRFHIDTRSAAESDTGSTFDFRHTSAARGRFGAGPWGVSASMQNTIGYVNTQSSRTTEELNTDLELNSSVELNFHSDYLPLNRMATQNQQNRIMANSRNPQAEIAAARERESQRRQARHQRDEQRRQQLETRLQPRQQPQIDVPEPPGGQRETGGGSGGGGGNSGGGENASQPATRAAPPPGSD
ncbi:hypothetical protein [Ferruginivarius sediminum]|uniref:Uncharacterized protein n=1 Tax=Ferruginivarius sediminum TaxID=2661937 RepID=A0A369T6Q0_9PROT|nr:hypothetical protein [Ferruginivarius sediminum]RDD60999.1 hypothetical protein DRB17_14835 [Ferruginivarius sediminum]